MSTRILTGDCRNTLKTMGDGTVQCVVTSPPYWGLRDYGVGGQLGLEGTPDEYVENLVEVFREVRRVLRDDGVCWLNLGDSYATSNPVGRRDGESELRAGRAVPEGSFTTRSRTDPKGHGLKPKDLVGIPWRVAFALQADGWWLRQDIIWSKNNPMPEPVKDRCTRSHEYLFMLTKSPRYYYDAEAIKEPVSDSETVTGKRPRRHDHIISDPGYDGHRTRVSLMNAQRPREERNRRSVWTINPRPYDGAHFAVMPPLLVEPCVLAGTSEAGCCPTCGAPWERETESVQGSPDLSQRSTSHYNTKDRYGARNGGNGGFDALAAKMRAGSHHKVTVEWRPTCKCPEHAPVPCTVLDPFGGSGTVGMVSRWLGRDAVLCELNPEYVKLIEERVAMERTETGGARRVEPVAGGGASIDLLEDLFGA